MNQFGVLYDVFAYVLQLERRRAKNTPLDVLGLGHYYYSRLRERSGDIRPGVTVARVPRPKSETVRPSQPTDDGCPFKLCGTRIIPPYLEEPVI